MADVNISARLVGDKLVRDGFASFERAAKRVAAGIVAAFSVRLLFNLTKGIIDSADQMEKLSIRLGTTSEALSELKFAAEQSNISFQTISLGMQRMTRRVAEAAQGTGEAKDAIAEFGLSAKELVKLAPEEQIKIFADSFAGLKSNADKVRLAMKLFDTEGVSLIQMFQGGAAGLEKFADEARKFGIVVDTESARGAAHFKEQIGRLEAAGKGWLQQGILPLLEPLASMAERLIDNSLKADKLAVSFSAITTGLKSVLTFAFIASATFTNIGKSIGAMAAAIVTFVTGNFAQAASIMRMRMLDMREERSELADAFEAIWGEVVHITKEGSAEMEKALGTGSLAGGKALDPLRDRLADLRKELFGLINGEGALLDYELTVGKLSEVTSDAAEELRDHIRVMGAQVVAQEKVNASIAAEIAHWDGLKQAWEDATDTRIEKEKEVQEELKRTAQEMLLSISPAKQLAKAEEELFDLLGKELIQAEEFHILMQLRRDDYDAATAALVGLTKAQRDAAEAQKAYEDDLDSLDQKLEDLTFPIVEFNKQMAMLDDLMARNRISSKEYAKGVKEVEGAFLDAVKAGETLTDWQKAMLRATEGFAKEFTDSIDSMLSGAASSFKDFQQVVFSLFRKAIIARYITKPLLDAIDEIIKGLNNTSGKGGFMSAIGSVIGGAIGGGGGAGGGGATTETPGFARGGVLPRGFTGIVGESGPELITPGSTSRITPNNQLGGITINQTFQTGVTRAELASIIPRIKAETIAAVAEAKMRGGRFSRAL